jgi:hypothetical protein
MPRSGDRPRVRIWTASLIAFTSLMGAVAAWGATGASGAAGSADRTGVATTLAQTQQRAGILVRADAVLFDYVRMHSYRDEAADLRAQKATASPEDAARLEVLAAADERVERTLRSSLDPDAIRPDGSLDLRRMFQIEYALAASNQDLDPRPHFAIADRKRSKAEHLVGLTMLFIAAALFLTIAQMSRSSAGRLYLFGGVAVLACATVLLVAVEVL